MMICFLPWLTLITATLHTLCDFHNLMNCYNEQAPGCSANSLMACSNDCLSCFVVIGMPLSLQQRLCYLFSSFFPFWNSPSSLLWALSFWSWCWFFSTNDILIFFSLHPSLSCSGQWLHVWSWTRNWPGDQTEDNMQRRSYTQMFLLHSLHTVRAEAQCSIVSGRKSKYIISIRFSDGNRPNMSIKYSCTYLKMCCSDLITRWSASVVCFLIFQ